MAFRVLLESFEIRRGSGAAGRLARGRRQRGRVRFLEPLVACYSFRAQAGRAFTAWPGALPAMTGRKLGRAGERQIVELAAADQDRNASWGLLRDRDARGRADTGGPKPAPPGGPTCL